MEALYLWLLALLISNSSSQSCDSDCLPAEDEIDCCTYANSAVYDYCESEIGETSSFSACNVNIHNDGDSSDSNDNNNNNNNDNSNAETLTTISNITTAFGCKFGWNIDFIDNSGQFKMYPCDDENIFLNIKLKNIQEYDENNRRINIHTVTSFEYVLAVSGEYTSKSDVYSWKDINGNDLTLNGVTVTYYFYISSTLVKFEMNLYSIDDITYLEYINGNKSYSEQLIPGTLKIDFYIKNWPFDSIDNTLGIEMRLITSGSNNNGSSDGSINGVSSFSWGDDFIILMPETYLHTNKDDYETGKNVDIDFNINENGKQVDIKYLFEQAGNAKKILYDPLVSNGFTDEESTGGDCLLLSNRMTIVSIIITSILLLIL